MPTFFVPFTPPQEADAAYESLARKAGCRATPSRAERIRSLMFSHNGETWTAEVGKRLHGRRDGEILVAGRPLRGVYETSDAAVVLAIFPGNPCVVMTDGGQAEGRPTRWSNRIVINLPEQALPFGATAQALPA